MQKKANRAQWVGPWDAVDCKAQQLGNPFSAKRAKNKAPAAGSSRRLTTSRQIEVVHHCTAVGVQTWHIVLTENASRKSVAAFALKREAIEQLGFFSKKLRARIVGRGSVVPQ